MKFLLTLGQTKTLLIVALVQCLVRSTYGAHDIHPDLLPTSIQLTFYKLVNGKLGLSFYDDGSISNVVDNGQAAHLSNGQLRPFSTITKIVSRGNFTIATEPDTNVDLLKDSKVILALIKAAIHRISPQTPLELTFCVPSSETSTALVKQTARERKMMLTCWLAKDKWYGISYLENLTFYFQDEELWCIIPADPTTGLLKKKVTTLAYNQSDNSKQTIAVRFENPKSDAGWVYAPVDATDRIINLDKSNRKYFAGMKRVFEWINTCDYDNSKVQRRTLDAVDGAMQRYPAEMQR